MAEVFFDNPPILNGSETDQLLQLQRYLNTMSEKLNTALMTISIEQLEPETRQVIRAASKEKTQNQYDTLKSLIIKTAEIVRNEMDEITTTLESHYQALSSQFGTYEENLTSTITATARGVLQDYGYDATLEALQSDATDARKYIVNASAYIFTGLLRDTGGVPVYGIAVGQNVTDPETGNLNADNRVAEFTAERLSFFQNGNEVAYFSNNVFYIPNGEVTQSMRMGNHVWKVLSNGALALVAGGTT